MFRNHLYNELVLEYMVDNYNGSDKDMYRWGKRASDVGVIIKNLSERLSHSICLLRIKIIMISLHRYLQIIIIKVHHS